MSREYDGEDSRFVSKLNYDLNILKNKRNLQKFVKRHQYVKKL